MMTDKPTSTESGNAQNPQEKANTITKSTQKNKSTEKTESTQKAVGSSSKSASQETVSVNMSNSTKAVTDNTTSNNKDSVDKSTQSTKNVKNTPVAPVKKSTNTSSASQQDKKSMKPESSSKISKLAVLSLLIALLAVAGVVFLYFWHIQQQEMLSTQLEKMKGATTQSNQTTQANIANKMKAQEKILAMKFSDSVDNMKTETQSSIAQLNEMVEKFSQNQPTDWLVHEAEYLVRIAARTLWLEKDSTAAIGLLQDADTRITELNDPELLPIRQLIYKDIESLKLVPKLEIEDAILSLMALGEQVQSLPLVTMSIPQESASADQFELSEDINDWRENISKTWGRFLETFVVVHSRVGELDPILPIDQRENLKENLSLKLQIAQWAASKGKHDVYVKSLTDAQSWLTQYFEMDNAKNTLFNESLESLKAKVIVTDAEQKIASLKAIRQVLTEREKSRARNASNHMIVMPGSVNTTDNAVEKIKEKIEEVPEVITETIDEVKPELQSVPAEIEQTIKGYSEPVVEKMIETPVEKVTEKAAEISEAA